MSDLRHRQAQHLFFTWTAQRGAGGFDIDTAEGAKFHVRDRGWLWDLSSQVYNVSVGHRHPHVQRRMVEQIEQLPAASPAAILPIRAELATLLHEKTGMAKAFMTTGGSEAVENAIKIARLITGREKIVTRRHSYHGATLTVLGVAGDPRKQPFVSWLPPAVHIEDPYPPRQPSADRPSNWVESLQEVFDREGPETIAAVLLEGFTGTNGMQIPPADFWPRVRELCDAHGVLCIDDEIFSGFGRTGRWFAKQHWGTRPDMMVVGKGLTSGYAPMAGVLVDERIAAHFEEAVLWCGLTSYAHPVSCAAAVGTIEVLEQQRLPENAARVGAVLGEHLARFKRAHEPVRDVRGLGLMQLMEFDRPAAPLKQLLLERGVAAPTHGPWLLVCPPLCLTVEEAEQVSAQIGDALTAFFGSS